MNIATATCKCGANNKFIAFIESPYNCKACGHNILNDMKITLSFIKEQINPNDCKICQWKSNKKYKLVNTDWCYWYYTEPTTECLYDKGIK